MSVLLRAQLIMLENIWKGVVYSKKDLGSDWMNPLSFTYKENILLQRAALDTLNCCIVRCKVLQCLIKHLPNQLGIEKSRYLLFFAPV